MSTMFSDLNNEKKKLYSNTSNASHWYPNAYHFVNVVYTVMPVIYECDLNIVKLMFINETKLIVIIYKNKIGKH